VSRSKYGAVRTELDGITFASKREAYRYATLRILEKGGKIADLELQPCYPITINGQLVCKVLLDFRYRDLDTGEVVIEDSKGRDNPLSKLKRKLVEAAYGIEVRLV
jgi:hypothetical protein